MRSFPLSDIVEHLPCSPFFKCLSFCHNSGLKIYSGAGLRRSDLRRRVARRGDLGSARHLQRDRRRRRGLAQALHQPELVEPVRPCDSRFSFRHFVMLQASIAWMWPRTGTRPGLSTRRGPTSSSIPRATMVPASSARTAPVLLLPAGVMLLLGAQFVVCRATSTKPPRFTTRSVRAIVIDRSQLQPCDALLRYGTPWNHMALFIHWARPGIPVVCEETRSGTPISCREWTASHFAEFKALRAPQWAHASPPPPPPPPTTPPPPPPKPQSPAPRPVAGHRTCISNIISW